MIVAILYILLFSAIIIFYKRKQFHLLPKWAYIVAFVAKVVCGFALTYIYTNYYPDRKTADIYKYYDDAKVMYGALEDKPGDYFRMLSGVDNNSLYFDTTYYAKMNNWYKRYDFGTYNDNHTIIRFNALIMPIAFGSFHVHTVFMCFISFIGLCMLAFVFMKYFPRKKWFVFLVVFGAPSVMFWGSGVLKEGILLFSVGLLFYTFYKLVEERKSFVLPALGLLLSLLIMLINKNYLLIALVPPLISYACIRFFRIQKTVIFFFLFHFILFGGGYAGLVLLKKSPLQAMSQKQKDFINLAKGGIFLLNDHHLLRIDPDLKDSALVFSGDSCKLKQGITCLQWNLFNFNDTITVDANADTANYKMIWELPKAGSLIQTKALDPNIMSALAFSPHAFFNVLMEPIIFRAKSLIEKMAALENLMIILFLAVCVLFSDQTNVNREIFQTCLYSVVILFLIIGFTTPVAGAIVRYKMPVIPLLLMLGVNILDPEKLRNAIPFLNKKSN